MFNFRINGIIAGAAFFLSFLVGLVSGAAMPMLLLKPLIFAAVFFALPSLARLLVEHFLPELLENTGSDGGSEFLPGSRVNIMEGDSSGYEDSQGLSSVPAFMMARQGDSEEALDDISNLARSGGASRVSGEERAERGAGAAAMDQNTQNGYTEKGDFPGAEAADIFDIDIFSEPLSGGNRAASGIGAGSAGVNFAGESSSNASAAMANSVNAAAANAARAGASAPSPGAASREFGRADASAAADFDSGEILRDLDSMAGAFVTGGSSQEEPETTEYSVTMPLKKPSQSRNQTWAGDFNAKDIAQGLRTVLNKDKEG